MKTAPNALPSLRECALFLVWGPPSHGPRSQVLARALGIDEIHFVYCTARRGLLWAPFKYSWQGIRTLRLLFRKRPKIVFVQSPPSIAVVVVYAYCMLTDSRYVVDAHSAALQHSYWMRPRWLHSFLARRAVATILTNEYLEQKVNRWGGDTFILRDIPTTFPTGDSHPLSRQFNVIVVNSFSDDEPLREVLEAASNLKGVQLYVTGEKRRWNLESLLQAPDNVHFTDFLPDKAYYALMNAGQAVMCLTTRDHTMQRGACEALSLGKPIITSDSSLLRQYFYKGAIHVTNTSESIRQGILKMIRCYPSYKVDIMALQKERREESEGRINLLIQLVLRSLQANPR